MRALIAVSMLSFIVSVAGAQTNPIPPPAATPTDSAGAQPGKRTTDRRTSAKTKETPNTKNADNDALASCLAMWDRGTHMSRQEWRRACLRVADRLQNLTVK